MAAPTSDDEWVPSNPKAEYCGRARRAMLKGRIVRFRRFFCGRWDCDNCGPRYKPRWVINLEALSGGELYARVLPREENWETTATRYRRGGIDWAVISRRDGEKVAVSSIEVDGTERVKDARRFLLDTIPDRVPRKPISTSQGWRLTEEAKEQEPGRWEVITLTLLEPEQIDAVCVGLGLEQVGAEDYVIPEGLDLDETRERLVAGLKGNIDPGGG